MGLLVQSNRWTEQTGPVNPPNNPALDISSEEEAEAGFSYISYADGFVAAIACGPASIPPAEWLPHVLDSLGLDVANEDIRLVSKTMLSAYRSIVKDLNSREGYEPLFIEYADGRLSTHDWAAGFIAATDLRQEQWDEVRERIESKVLFTMLAALLQDEKVDAGLIEQGLDPEKLFAMACEDLPNAIDDFYSLRPQVPYSSHDAVPAAKARLGRNDPCPCGSGKKYKKCCLN